MRPRIGITLGDCAGIGPEIVDAALKSGRLSAAAEYKIVGKYPDCSLGQPSLHTARAAAAALEEAATMARRGELDAVVTGPIHKAKMHEAGFQFPGQTEFFAARCGVKDYAMLLTGGKITVALVTTHLPLGEVPGALKKAEIVRVGRLLMDFLISRSNKPPRIAVAGLNPHAGESGKIGREEIEVITPAVAELNDQPSTKASPVRQSDGLVRWRARTKNQPFSGPLSPDTLFHRLVEGEFDAALCMYHDQGLIPLKLHAFHNGVNVTLGLPFPRTSPDHGTAFDIAGRGIAKPDSMMAAMNLAVELAEKKRATRS